MVARASHGSKGLFLVRSIPLSHRTDPADSHKGHQRAFETPYGLGPQLSRGRPVIIRAPRRNVR